MEDGDVEHLLKGLLDVEALRCFDVLQVNAAECRGDRPDNLDDLVWVLAVHFDIKDINIRKFLEQHSFAFHHRLGSECPAVPQSQDGRAVRDHPHQIAARGVVKGFLGVLIDLQDRFSHPRRISQG